MTPDEQIVKMTKAINQAIKVMGDRFGSTEGDVARAIEAPYSRLQGIFEVQGSEEARFPCCSLTRQQAAGNALAMHFQDLKSSLQTSA